MHGLFWAMKEETMLATISHFFVNHNVNKQLRERR
jgi:hypothetical protein